MTILISSACAFSSGSLSTLYSTSGTVALNSTTPIGSNKYDLKVSGASYALISSPRLEEIGTLCVAFKVKFSSIQNNTFFSTSNGGADSNFALRCTSTGKLAILANDASFVETSANNIFSSGTEYQIVAYVATNGKGTRYRVAVDGTNAVAGDASSSTVFDGANTRVAKLQGTNAGTDVYFADFCWLDDNTGASADFESSVEFGGYDVLEFMVAGTGFTTGGSSLNTGTWDLTGEQPLTSGTNHEAIYSSVSADGYGVTNGSLKSGPSGVLDSGDTIIGAFIQSVAYRGGGGSTTHALQSGKYKSPTATTEINNYTSLTTSPTTQSFRVGSTYVPAYDYYFVLGGYVSGGQDLCIVDTYAYLVVEAGSGTQNLTPSRYDKSHTFYSATVGRGPVGLTPSRYDNAHEFYAPSVKFVIGPSRYDNAHEFYSSTVAAHAHINPNRYDNAHEFFTPVVEGENEVFPSLYTNSHEFFTHVVNATYDLAPSLYDRESTFYTHEVLRGPVDLTPSLYAEEHTFYTPEVTRAGETQGLEPSLFVNSNDFFSPAVTATYDLDPPYYENTKDFFTHSVTATYDLAPDLYSEGHEFFSASVSATYELTPGLFANTNDFFTPTANSTYGLTPSRYDNAHDFFSPSVTATYDITPSLFSEIHTFYTAVVFSEGAPQGLFPDRFDESHDFFAAALSSSYGLEPGIYSNTNDFHSPTVAANYDILPDRYDEEGQFFNHTLTSTYDVAPSLYVNENDFPGHVVINVNTLSPIRHDEGHDFPTAIITSLATLLPERLDEVHAFYIHVLIAENTPQALTQSAIFVNDHEFPPATVTLETIALERPAGGYFEVSTLRERGRLRKKERKHKKITREIIRPENEKKNDVEINLKPDLADAWRALEQWKQAIDRQILEEQERNRLELDRLVVANKLRRLSDAERQEREAYQIALEQALVDVVLQDIREAEEAFEVNLLLNMLLELKF